LKDVQIFSKNQSNIKVVNFLYNPRTQNEIKKLGLLSLTYLIK